MELRSRSRSKTPFQTESFLEAETFGENHVMVTRTSRRSTVKAGVTTDYSYESTKPVKSKSTKATRSIYKTSDYSSEEGDYETASHISQNQKNQIIEDAKAAANGTAEVSALNLYRRAGRYWDKYPKTDYTYSRHSRDRVEIAPGVVQMPNMSRRTIHLDSSTNTDSFYTSSKSELVKQRLFSCNNNDENVTVHTRTSTVFYRFATAVFMTVFTAIYWCVHSVYRTANSTTIYLGKHLHHLASRVMLWDTWLLRRSSAREKRTKAVLALCLLPLLLFAAWFLLSSLGSAIYWSYFNPSVRPHLPLEEPQRITASLNLDQVTMDEIVERLLRDPKIYNVINNYHSDKDKSNDKFFQLISELKTEINTVKNDLFLAQQTKAADINRALSQIRAEHARSFARLGQRISRCCGKQTIDLEPYITKVFGDLLNDPEFLSHQQGLTDWLYSLFVAKNHLEGRLANLTESLTQNFDISIHNTANQVMDKVVTKLSDRPLDSGTITEEQIKKVVHSALRVYDADKTGLVDYAMEPLGGQIVTTRCTESYHSGTAVISVMGIPVWYPTISPRVVISPGVSPGECWAFQNFPGFLVIKLAAKVNISAFSMEHVSRLLVPDGRIDSAPKDFEVYGLEEENDRDPVLIGEYVYDYDGESIQYFTAQSELSFRMIEIRIKSNHGNPNYTCLYRFRVHGAIDHEPT